MKPNIRGLWAITAFLPALAIAATAFAQKPGGTLRMYNPESVASLSMLEEFANAELPIMEMFNNLVMFDQHVAQNSLQSIVDRQPLIRAVAELFHDLARLGAVLFDIGAVAGQGLQYLPRHAPGTVGRWQHIAADRPFPLVEDVEKGLAIERQAHGPAQLRVVERWRGGVDQQCPWHIASPHLAQHLRRLFLKSLNVGMLTFNGIMSNFPAKKARLRGPASRIIVYSMPSR
jgi:hypothetical protein